MSTTVVRPPRTPGLPFIGSALDIARAPARYFVDAYQQYGPVFRVRIPTAANGELTFMAGTEANLFAQREGSHVFTTREYYHHLAHETGTDNYLCTLDGAAHRYMRRTLKPGFSREAMAPFLPAMIDIVREAAQSWASGSRIPVLKTLNRLTINQLSVVAMNRVIDDDAYADLEAYARVFVGAGVAMHPPLLFHMPWYRRAKHRFEAFLSDAIEEHRESPLSVADRMPDLIDLLLSAAYSDGTAFNHADLVANAHLPFVNGLIYAGRICAYMLYALLRDRPLLERVRAEVDAAFADGYPTINTFRHMPLLRGAIMETYRLYPIAPSVPRYAAQSFDFAGYHIEAGTTVLIAMIVPHFDPSIYPSPYDFDPERFREPRSEHRVPGAFSPYGLGAHVCLSIGMVETVVMTTLCALLREIDMELAPPDYEIRTRVDPVPGPEDAFAFQVLGHRSELASPAASHLLTLQISETLPMLNDRQIEDVAAHTETRTYPPGAVIIRENDPADSFYIISEGQAEVIKTASDGQTHVVAHLGTGDYFGEIGLLHGVPRSATVRAVSTLEVIVIPREDFLNLVYESDLTSREISEVVQHRLIVTTLATTLPSLTLAEIEDLVPQFGFRTYAPGETIIQEGEPAEHFYVIVRGQVVVTNDRPNGADIWLGELGAGDFFGEIGLLQERPRTATVRAVPTDPVDVIVLDRDRFQEMIDHSQGTGEHISLTMMQRVLEQLQDG